MANVVRTSTAAPNDVHVARHNSLQGSHGRGSHH